MAKCYTQAPDEVRDRVRKLIQRFHPDLEKVGVRIDLLFATTDTDGAAAVSHGGYPAYAVVRILSLKDRTMDRGDAEIVVDQVEYEAMEDANRDALLDHELYHLEIKRDKAGRPAHDDHHRPLLKLRKHDRQFGWFDEIARRHKDASIEVTQATALKEEVGQLYLDFDGGKTVPFQRLCRGHNATVTIGGGGKSVTIDADGVKQATAAA